MQWTVKECIHQTEEYTLSSVQLPFGPSLWKSAWIPWSDVYLRNAIFSAISTAVDPLSEKKVRDAHPVNTKRQKCKTANQLSFSDSHLL